MKLVPSTNGFTKGKYDITVDNRPGAIEIRELGDSLSLRIFAVAPMPYGMSHSAGFGGSSANAYILEKSAFLHAQTKNPQWIKLNLLELIWGFCSENEIELNPIEFDINGFIRESLS